MNVTRASNTGVPQGPVSFILSLLIVPVLVFSCWLCLLTMQGWPLFIFVGYIFIALDMGVKNK